MLKTCFFCFFIRYLMFLKSIAKTIFDDVAAIYRRVSEKDRGVSEKKAHFVFAPNIAKLV